MPRFLVEWEINMADLITNTYFKSHQTLKLSDEWSLEIFFLDYSTLGIVTIHRKNPLGKFLISGEFELNNSGIRKTFSQYIKTGSLQLQIDSCVNGSFSSPFFYLHGFVDISDTSEKHSINSATEESKERNSAIAKSKPNPNSAAAIQSKSLEELSKDLERILVPESPCFADVTLKCGGVSILAHKLILSARSPVFAAMFANPMKESHKSEVDITDIKESVLRACLKYLYTGKTSDLTDSSAADLLFAADKYQLHDLKKVCSYFLKNTVSLQNAWVILVLGDLHDEDLKSFAMDYICNECSQFSVVENTQEWKALRKERPDLAMDVLESLVKYREDKMKK